MPQYRPTRRERSARSSSPQGALAATLCAVLCVVSLGLAPGTAEAKRADKIAFREGQASIAAGNFDWAVVHFQRAVDLRPDNRDYRAALTRSKAQASYQHFELAKRYLHGGNLESAITELQQTVNLNPAHQYAYVELEKAIELWRSQQQQADDEVRAFEQAKRASIRDAAAPPKLDPTANIPIIWDMEETTVKDIFGVIRDVANINVIFDEGVHLDDKTDFITDNVTLEEALDLLMLKLGLAYKVYNDHTILVYQDNQTKRREYEDQVIQTFYLSNADVKDVNALLRGVVDIRKTAVNEDLNAITILDTQDKIAIAGRLIERNDKAKAELVIDLEILEVNRSKLKQWGIDITTGGESGGIASTISFDDDQVRLNNLQRFNQLGSYVFSGIPSAVISLVKNDTDTRTLSRPQARVTDGEKVTVHIGDQVPIPNTTFNTSSSVGSNIVPVTSFTYQNVGIQINLEPRVHHNREITLKMQTEISAVTSVSSGGQPTIGNREIDSVIRLRDGETNLLAGLFQENRQDSDGGVPGLMHVPFLRRIFGSHQRQGQETEIILTVTPHIIRIPDITVADLGPLHVGTDKDRRLRGESKYGVGGSPFRRPDENETKPLFDSLALAPGRSLQDANTLTNPDLDLASGLRSAAPPAPGATPPSAGAAAPGASPAPARGGASSPGGGSAGAAPSPGGRPVPPAGPQQSPASGSGPVRLALSGPGSVGLGERFSVQVRVDTGAHSISDAPYHVVFDPARVEISSVTEGSFFLGAGLQSVFLPNVSPGRIVIGHSMLGRGTPPAGSGVLAEFQVIGRSAGVTLLEIVSASPSDRTGDVLPVTVGGLRVDVRP